MDSIHSLFVVLSPSIFQAEFKKEWDVYSTHVPIPYLGFGVGGIEFGFTVYGGLGIGVEIEIDYVTMGYTAHGSITRGIEYDAENNVQNYIADSFICCVFQHFQLKIDYLHRDAYLPSIYSKCRFTAPIRIFIT